MFVTSRDQQIQNMAVQQAKRAFSTAISRCPVISRRLPCSRPEGIVSATRTREESMIRRIHGLCALLLLAFVTAGPGRAEPVLPMAATPEEVGLSSAQLARIEAVTQRHIETGLVPGAVMLVARRGKIAWTRTMGFRDRAAKDPMRPDSIFRIYSMTKPIVSVAAMMLV